MAAYIRDDIRAANVRCKGSLASRAHWPYQLCLRYSSDIRLSGVHEGLVGFILLALVQAIYIGLRLPLYRGNASLPGHSAQDVMQRQGHIPKKVVLLKQLHDIRGCVMELAEHRI